jgi:hypothetical protein
MNESRFTQTDSQPAAIVVPRWPHRPAFSLLLGIVKDLTIHTTHTPHNFCSKRRVAQPGAGFPLWTRSRSSQANWQPDPSSPGPPWLAHTLQRCASLAPLRLNRVTGQSGCMHSFQIRNSSQAGRGGCCPFPVGAVCFSLHWQVCLPSFGGFGLKRMAFPL